MLLPAARAVARRPLISVPSALRQQHLHLHHASLGARSVCLNQRQRPTPEQHMRIAIRTYALVHDPALFTPVESLSDVSQVLKDADWMLLRLEPPLPGGMMMYRVRDLAEDPGYALEQAYVALGSLAGSLARGAKTFSKTEWRDQLSGTSLAFKGAMEKQTAELVEFGDEHAKYTERLAAAKVLKARVESAQRWLETEKGSQTRLEQRASRERDLMESRIDSLEKKIEEGEKNIRIARATKQGLSALAPAGYLVPLIGKLNSTMAAGLQDEITALRAKRDTLHTALTRNYATDDSEAHKQYLAARTLNEIGKFAESLQSKVARLEAASVAGGAELDAILAAKAAVARIFDRHLADMVAEARTTSVEAHERDTARSILQILLLTPEKPAKLWIEAEKVCEVMARLPDAVLGGGAGEADYGEDETVGELLKKVQELVAGKVATEEVRKWKRMASGWGRRRFR